MGFFEYSAAVLVGNLLAAWFISGLHIATLRAEDRTARLLFGGASMVMAAAIAIHVSDGDMFSEAKRVAFVAALATFAFVWGGYTIMKHERRGSISTAPLIAWAATLAPLLFSVAFLWRYAPIG